MASKLPVLVVDDEENIREFIELILEDEGYEVLTASDGKVALDLVKVAAPRLILLDMRMPVMDGWEFARIYQADFQGTAPIVVLTAATDAAKFATQIKATDYLAKPFDLDELLTIVEKYTTLSKN